MPTWNSPPAPSVPILAAIAWAKEDAHASDAAAPTSTPANAPIERGRIGAAKRSLRAFFIRRPPVGGLAPVPDRGRTSDRDYSSLQRHARPAAFAQLQHVRARRQQER